MIISILNLKGGSGKTTIATNLVFALSRQIRCLLIDTDRQQSSMTWYNFRTSLIDDSDDRFNVVSITEPAALKKQLPIFSRDYPIIILDGAPQIDVLNAACVTGSDIIIIPVAPSPYDIWATETIVQRIQTAQEIRPHLKAFFVINRDNPQTRLSREVTEALHLLSLPLLNSHLRNRIVYADSAQNGYSVLESSNTAAINEFRLLAKEIQAAIKESQQ